MSRKWGKWLKKSQYILKKEGQIVISEFLTMQKELGKLKEKDYKLYVHDLWILIFFF